MKCIYTFLSMILFCSFVQAMDPLPDETLAEITGRSGLSAFFMNGDGNIGMNVTFKRVTWGDQEDGNKGFVHIHGYDDLENNDNFSQSGIGFEVESSLLTIDIDPVEINNGQEVVTTTKLLIDLPELTSTSLLANYYVINLSSSAYANTPLNDTPTQKNLGVLYTGGTELTIPSFPDKMEIWAH
jgi:hypothetical protein